MRTILGVWAHPDDEAYLSGGLMAAARSRGARVVVATATRGELGGDARLRERELRASLAAVGVHEHVWLGFADGGCADVPVGIGAGHVERIIDAVRPDTILTFGPDGITGHDDHRAVSAWTTTAWEAHGRRARLLYAALTPSFYEEWGERCEDLGMWMDDERSFTPEESLALTFECRGEVLERKLAALRAHASQTDGLRSAVGDATYRRMWVRECFADAAAVRTEARSA